jgi:hypothetical protein
VFGFDDDFWQYLEKEALDIIIMLWIIQEY